jgi:long-subunit acyl-CoA synthetase (AMP-forming)
MERKFKSFREMLQVNSSLGTKGALVFYECDKISSLSYQSLYQACLKEEQRFRLLHISSVAFLEEKSPRLVVSFFGAVLAGLKTTIIDPSETDSRISTMLEAFKPERLELGDDFSPEDCEALHRFIVPPKVPNSAGEGEIVFFTSGTSAPSKGVRLTSQSLLASAWSGQMMLPCHQDDQVLSLLPLSHVFGFVCTMLWPLAYQASCLLGRGLRAVLTDPSLFKPTILPVIPSLAMLLAMRHGLNKELKTILVGAGPLDKATIGIYQQTGISLAFGYGLTETSSGVAISVGSQDPLAMSICPGCEIKISPEGTLMIKTDAMMKGYLDSPSPDIDNDGFFHTGDLGFFDKDGKIHVTGRQDDIIVLANGTKFDCAQAEQTLSALLLGLDFALKEDQGAIALKYYLPPNSPDLVEKINKAVEAFNASMPLYSKIASIQKSPSPLKRTRTGKIIRREL